MLTHRRHNSELTDKNVRLFAEGDNTSYGDHVWTLVTELPEVDQELIEFAAEWYETDLEEAELLVNPERIISSAGAWDDAEFVSHVWMRFEKDGYRTNDGAVVLNIHDVELTYHFDDSDYGDE